MVKVNILDNASGSSEFSQNGVKVICGINGPLEYKLSRQDASVQCAIDINVSPNIGSASPKEKLLEAKIRLFINKVIHVRLYPKQVILLNLQILENSTNLKNTQFETGGKAVSNESNDGADDLLVLNCCINSIFLALVDASISLKFAFNSIIMKFDDNNQLVTFKNNADGNCTSKHLVVYSIVDGNIGEILFTENLGSFKYESFDKFLNISESKSLQLHNQFRTILNNSISNRFVFMKQ